MKNMYVLVRKDLPCSSSAVQAGHALAEYMIKYPNNVWNNNTLIYLGINNKLHLDMWKDKILKEKLDHAIFYEPDINNEPTAIAIYADKNIFKNLKLLK